MHKRDEKILVGLSSAACDGDAQLASCVASFSTRLQKNATKKRLRKYQTAVKR